MHIIPSSFRSVAAILVVGILGLLAAPAMAWDWTFGTGVSGSGQLSKSQRQVSNFKGVSLELPADVEIVQGETEGVLIETDDNIAPLLETLVDHEQLRIRLTQRFKSIKPTSLKITVNARNVERLAISGSGDIRAGKLRSPTLEAHITGSGDIRIAALEVQSLSVSIAGNGDFFAAGRADTTSLSIAGSGDLKTERLAARNVKLSIAGSGDAKVWASQTFDVNIAGSGDVGYYGDPAVTRSVAGSGRIRKLGTTPDLGN